MGAFLWRVAGVEPSIIKNCPGTDKVWAIQLGISLLFTFAFVFGLTYYSISYFIHDPWGRLVASFLVASVVALFDRALFQSDWFIVAALAEAVAPGSPRRSFGAGLRRWTGILLRLLARLSISLVIAYTLALFAEIAVFGDAIAERLGQTLEESNAPYKRKVDDYRNSLNAETSRRRQEIVDLEAERKSLEQSGMNAEEREAFDRYEAQRKDATGRLADLRRKIEEFEKQREAQDADAAKFQRWAKAEETGRPAHDHIPGPAGCHTKCQGFQERRDLARKESDSLRIKIDEHRTAIQEHGRKAEQAERELEKIRMSREERNRTRISEISADIRKKEAALTEHENGISGEVLKMEEELKRQGHFRVKRDDPIVRIGVLHQLRHDPEKGPAISEMSLLIKIFICFLEIAPVLAKMFFFPPTVYAALVKGLVVLGQTEALRLMNAAMTPAASSIAPKVEAAAEEEERRLQRSRLHIRDWFDGIERKFFESIGRSVPSPSPKPA